MMQKGNGIDKCIVISLRHLGDAVIVSGFINAFVKQNPDVKVDVLGRLDLREITTTLCSFRNFIPIDIPLIGHHRKDFAALLGAMRTIVRLRKERYDRCINLTGDFRENAIAWMLGAHSVYAPEWPQGHRFRKHIRTFSCGSRKAGSNKLQHRSQGYYAAIDSFAQELGFGKLCWPESVRRPIRSGGLPVLGLHPGASHVSKQWPTSKWKMLIRLLAGKVVMRLYGSPSEAANLHREFQSEIEEYGLELITGGITGFLQSLRMLDALICVDSFSSHAAHAVGVPTIVLFGPFDPIVMTPPTGIALSAGSQCAMFPCYNGRSCKNHESPYVCVQGITTEAVIGLVEAKITQFEQSLCKVPDLQDNDQTN